MNASLRALSLLLLQLPVSALAQNLVSNGDFENNFDGWTVVQQALVDSSNVHSGQKSFKASDPDSSSYGYLWRAFPLAYSQNEISFWVYPASASYFTAFELIRQWQAGTAIFNTRVLMTENSIAFTAVDTSTTLLEPLVANQWNKVSVQVDTMTRRQDFFVNDQLAASLVSDTLPAVEHLLVGDLSITGMYGTVYFDDISIIGGELVNLPPRPKDDRLELDLPVSGLLSGSMNVLTNDGDPNGDPLTVTSFDAPASGAFVWAADGAVSFELTGWDAADTLRHVLDYTVSDGVLSATGALTISYGGGVPVAVEDRYVDSGSMPKFFPVLRNDVLPPGVSVEITIDKPPDNGQILSVEPDGIWYQKNAGFEGQDEIIYGLTTTTQAGKITKSQTLAPLLLEALLCACGFLEDEWPNPATCNNEIRFVPDPLRLLLAGKSDAGPMPADSLDIDLVLQARDQLLRTTEVGLALVEDFVLNSPEILQLVLFDQPHLRDRAVSTMALLQGPARNLLVGDGSRVITQAEMDSVSAFFEEVSAGVSDELNAILQTHLANLGPFDQYVGMTVKKASETLGGLTTDVEDETPEMQDDFILEPNFPNPFSNATQIRYRIEERASVTLAIYDIQGRLVQKLVSGRQEFGAQTVTWDGRNYLGVSVPPGTYFVRLSTPVFQRTKKVVVIR